MHTLHEQDEWLSKFTTGDPVAGAESAEGGGGATAATATSREGEGESAAESEVDVLQELLGAERRKVGPI